MSVVATLMCQKTTEAWKGHAWNYSTFFHTIAESRSHENELVAMTQ